MAGPAPQTSWEVQKKAHTDELMVLASPSKQLAPADSSTRCVGLDNVLPSGRSTTAAEAVQQAVLEESRTYLCGTCKMPGYNSTGCQKRKQDKVRRTMSARGISTQVHTSHRAIVDVPGTSNI